jgi:hypothetical protein
MTEPNQAPEAEAPEPEAAVAWPTLPSELPGASQSGTQNRTQNGTQDAAVDALLERLGALVSTPVSGHGEAYAALHDDLMEALNEDVAGQINSMGDAAP